MPIASLSPRATAELKSYLERQGVSTEGLETKTLGDLGDVGKDLAKKWADDWKDASPASFYGVLGAVGAAVGAYGYLEGSEALKDLGIKPELKTSLFDNKVKLRAEAMWESRFKNFGVAGDVEGNFNLGGGSALALRIRSGFDSQSLEDTTGDARLRWGNDATHLDVGVNGGVDGVSGYTLGGRLSSGNWSLHGNSTFDSDLSFEGGRVGGTYRFNNNGSAHLNVDFNSSGNVEEINGGLSYDIDRFSVRGSYHENLIRDELSVDLSATYRPTDDLELGLRSSYNTDTGGYVGVGATWRF